jgi:Tol biopolymer transport system component
MPPRLALTFWLTFLTIAENNRGSAQPQLPATDIFLAGIGWREGRVVVSHPVNITKKEGYDNQPSFMPDGSGILYTSIGIDGQADIFRYDFRTKTSKEVIQTPESEYSPSVARDGRSICVVRVETDSTQRLWKFDSSGANPQVLFPSVKPIGYYAWGNADIAALFVLGSPPTLQLADLKSGSVEVAEKGIGRSIQKVPGEPAISFVHKQSDSEWWIVRLDVETREKAALARTMKAVEDYCWLPDGSILAGTGSKLFRWKSGSAWEEVADLTSAGLSNITRLAVDRSGKHVAIVAMPIQQ